MVRQSRDFGLANVFSFMSVVDITSSEYNPIPSLRELSPRPRFPSRRAVHITFALVSARAPLGFSHRPNSNKSISSQHVYEVRPRKDKRGVDLISDALPFGGLWYTKPDDAIGYAKFRSRSHHAVIRVYDSAGNVIETHDHGGDSK
jgi:hypothetical protein